MSGKRVAWVIAAGMLVVGSATAVLLAAGLFDPTEATSPFTAQDSATATPTSPPPRHRGPPPEIALAAQLMDDIPAGAKVAIHPLDQRYAGLESAIGDPLYERLLLALSNAAEDNVTLLARERLHAIYSSLEEFYQGDT